MIEATTRRTRVKNSSPAAKGKRNVSSRGTGTQRISREPMSLGELLAPLVGIKDRPDREEILRNFFSRL